ncbi:cation:proton antiporter [Bdellovibrio sp. NC01]|uniref:cation:proton antiporter n=1 Tax=Bdellovibrio sp. NC01 TaxID=2220073 RepID=UPI00115A64A5|nr:cation:proton antiporter [Bdellovibrio sp. NC01]QDK39487.1 cation:proton antiporter [Bdellovibrio sp. NC01]
MKLFLFLLIGLLLGPSALGWRFPTEVSSLVAVCSNLFLFVAGLELSLKKTREPFSKAVKLSFGAFLPPFIVGLLMAFFLITDGNGQPLAMNTAIFIAIALSVSALPVAIQILKDLGLYESEMGRLIVSAATLCDIIAWVAFAFLLPSEGIGPWLQSHISVIFFFLGLIVSDTRFGQPRLRGYLVQASKWVFGPVFFISIGWKLNLWQNLHLTQILIVMIVACTTKFVGSYFAAKKIGYSHKRSTLIGLALNSRGAVEIIIASLALKQNLIDQTLFATLVIMAVVTSLLPEPLTHIWKLKEE